MKKAQLVVILSVLFSLSLFLFTGQTLTSAQSLTVSASPKKMDPQAIRLTINRLLLDHAALATLHLQAVYQGKDSTPSRQALDDNATKLASVLSYNTTINQQQFITLWHQHLTEYERYTKALQTNDQNTMQDSRNKLHTIATQLGQTLAVTNRAITPDMLTQHFDHHMQGTLGIIDAYAQQNQTVFISRVKDGSEQAKVMADVLTENFTTINR